MNYFTSFAIVSTFYLGALNTKCEKSNSKNEMPSIKNCSDEVKWKGIIWLEDLPGPKNYYMLNEEFFIHNSVAEVKQEFSQSYRFWTNIELEIPCAKQISADDIKIEWRGKSNMSLGLAESDMGITLIGDKETAQVNCITYYRPPYCVFRFGKKIITDVPEIVNNPSTWAVYSIQIKEEKMSFYKDNILLKELKDKQTIGLLKKFNIHFKGSGKVDWVKLFHKNKLAMQEDFNDEEKSSVEWK